MEHTFENITTRKYTVGTCTITWVDNGNQRKAWLELKGKQLAKWEETDGERWVASAMVQFVNELKDRKFAAEDTFCIFACIGRALEARNAGLYWHDLQNPGKIATAISTAQHFCGLIFRLNPKYSQAYRKLAASRTPEAFSRGEQRIHH